MFCKYCGNQLEENAKICSSCGNAITEDAPTLNQQTETPFEYSIPFAGKAIASFVLSLVGIIIAAIPCGILGIVFSALSMQEIKRYEYRGIGLAVAGLVISIIDIVLGLVWFVL